jgi:hypothetical protein
MNFSLLLRHDIVIRAAKTFVQAFLAVLLAGVLNVTDLASVKALGLAALAAGVSATWNLILNLKG